MNRQEMIERLIQKDIEVSMNDPAALYDLFLDGCTGYDEMGDDEIAEKYAEQFGEDDEGLDYTPGPWSVGLESNGEKGQIIDGYGQHIAYIECDPVIGNTRLVRAAPEMYEALKEVAAIRADSNSEPDDMADALDQIINIVDDVLAEI